MTKIKFSICIPNYNYAGYIGKTIQSVMDQNYPAHEIIIADNNSTDKSIEVIKSFKDDRIKIIQNPINFGFGPNLDIVTEQATGDFIILLSSDDLMLKNALEVYASNINDFENKSELILFSAYDIIDGNDKICESKDAIPSHLKKAIVNNEFQYIKKGNSSVINGLDVIKILFTTTLSSAGLFCSTCYSRNIYKKIGGYRSSTTIIPDATFIHKACFTNAKFIYTSEKLFQYRNHDANNLSGTNKMKNIKLLTDKYVITQLYSESDLKLIGLNQNTIKNTFIRHYCIEVPFYSILRRNLPKAYYHWIFGLASYPEISIRYWKFYFILISLPLLVVYHLLTIPFKGK